MGIAPEKATAQQKAAPVNPNTITGVVQDLDGKPYGAGQVLIEVVCIDKCDKKKTKVKIIASVLNGKEGAFTVKYHGTNCPEDEQKIRVTFTVISFPQGAQLEWPAHEGGAAVNDYKDLKVKLGRLKIEPGK
jgi:hypothetical protein